MKEKCINERTNFTEVKLEEVQSTTVWSVTGEDNLYLVLLLLNENLKVFVGVKRPAVSIWQESCSGNGWLGV